MSKIAIDAMGGDNAPAVEVAGALEALRASDVELVLVGDEARVREEVRTQGGEESTRLSIVHADEVVDMGDHPGKVFRQKPRSSMRLATDLVVSGKASAMVSAGNSGAILSHCLFLMKRLPGVERPGIVQVFPTPHGTVAMCDLGANTAVTPTMMAQFGIMAVHYDRLLNGTAKPRLGVLSNGTEPSKGTDLTRETCELLAQAAEHPDAHFEFVGYVEGSGVFEDKVDVVATDGFTGNIFLKTAEGVSEALMRMVRRAMLSTTRSKIGAVLARPALLGLRREIHYSEYGGAMLLGVNGNATICHGKSDSRAICNAILLTRRFVADDLLSKLRRAIDRHQDLWSEVRAEESA